MLPNCLTLRPCTFHFFSHPPSIWHISFANICPNIYSVCMFLSLNLPTCINENFIFLMHASCSIVIIILEILLISHYYCRHRRKNIRFAVFQCFIVAQFPIFFHLITWDNMEFSLFKMVCVNKALYWLFFNVGFPMQ